MLDLKNYFDAVNAADAEVQRIANEIDAAFKDGSEESKLHALVDLRPALDDAQKKYADALALYESMQKANRPNDIAKNFVPISDQSTEPAEGSQPTTIKRADYDKLSLNDRAAFIRTGGTLED